MLRIECTGDEATIHIEDLTNYLINMSELMTGCQAAMAHIAKETGVSYSQLMNMFLYCMKYERHSRPEQIE